jgi:multidrug transporter EmrE-like cation transporter
VAWPLVFLTVTCTVYGQLILKWQVDKAGAVPDSTRGQAGFVLGLLANPWVISVFAAAAIAALAWIGALTRIELGRAYPFVGLTFVTTLIGSALFFGEPLSAPKVAGTLLVVVGVVVASQG